MIQWKQQSSIYISAAAVYADDIRALDSSADDLSADDVSAPNFSADNVSADDARALAISADNFSADDIYAREVVSLPCCIKHRCARQCFQRHSGRKNPPRRRGGAPDAASYHADRPEDKQMMENR